MKRTELRRKARLRSGKPLARKAFGSRTPSELPMGPGFGVGRASLAKPDANQGKYPGPPGSDLRVTRFSQPGQVGRRAARSKPFPPAVAALLDIRDEWCQRCGSPRDLERHHRRGKASGGSQNRSHAHCPCNGVRLCPPCHRWAHRLERREAEVQGFIVSQSVDEPGSVSVMRGSEDGGGAAMYPTCTGEWLSEPAGEVAA